MCSVVADPIHQWNWPWPCEVPCRQGAGLVWSSMAAVSAPLAEASALLARGLPALVREDMLQLTQACRRFVHGWLSKGAGCMEGMTTATTVQHVMQGVRASLRLCVRGWWEAASVAATASAQHLVTACAKEHRVLVDTLLLCITCMCSDAALADAFVAVGGVGVVASALRTAVFEAELVLQAPWLAMSCSPSQLVRGSPDAIIAPIITLSERSASRHTFFLPSSASAPVAVRLAAQSAGVTGTLHRSLVALQALLSGDQGAAFVVEHADSSLHAGRARLEVLQAAHRAVNAARGALSGGVPKSAGMAGPLAQAPESEKGVSDSESEVSHAQGAPVWVFPDGQSRYMRDPVRLSSQEAVHAPKRVPARLGPGSESWTWSPVRCPMMAAPITLSPPDLLELLEGVEDVPEADLAAAKAAAKAHSLESTRASSGCCDLTLTLSRVVRLWHTAWNMPDMRCRLLRTPATVSVGQAPELPPDQGSNFRLGLQGVMMCATLAQSVPAFASDAQAAIPAEVDSVLRASCSFSAWLLTGASLHLPAAAAGVCYIPSWVGGEDLALVDQASHWRAVCCALADGAASSVSAATLALTLLSAICEAQGAPSQVPISTVLYAPTAVIVELLRTAVGEGRSLAGCHALLQSPLAAAALHVLASASSTWTGAWSMAATSVDTLCCSVLQVATDAHVGGGLGDTLEAAARHKELYDRIASRWSPGSPWQGSDLHAARDAHAAGMFTSITSAARQGGMRATWLLPAPPAAAQGLAQGGLGAMTGGATLASAMAAFLGSSVASWVVEGTRMLANYVRGSVSREGGLAQVATLPALRQWSPAVLPCLSAVQPGMAPLPRVLHVIHTLSNTAGTPEGAVSLAVASDSWLPGLLQSLELYMSLFQPGKAPADSFHLQAPLQPKRHRGVALGKAHVGEAVLDGVSSVLLSMSLLAPLTPPQGADHAQPWLFSESTSVLRAVVMVLSTAVPPSLARLRLMCKGARDGGLTVQFAAHAGCVLDSFANLTGVLAEAARSLHALHLSKEAFQGTQGGVPPASVRVLGQATGPLLDLLQEAVDTLEALQAVFDSVEYPDRTPLLQWREHSAESDAAAVEAEGGVDGHGVGSAASPPAPPPRLTAKALHDVTPFSTPEECDVERAPFEDAVAVHRLFRGLARLVQGLGDFVQAVAATAFLGPHIVCLTHPRLPHTLTAGLLVVQEHLAQMLQLPHALEISWGSACSALQVASSLLGCARSIMDVVPSDVSVFRDHAPAGHVSQGFLLQAVMARLHAGALQAAWSAWHVLHVSGGPQAMAGDVCLEEGDISDPPPYPCQPETLPPWRVPPGSASAGVLGGVSGLSRREAALGAAVSLLHLADGTQGDASILGVDVEGTALRYAASDSAAHASPTPAVAAASHAAWDTVAAAAQALTKVQVGVEYVQAQVRAGAAVPEPTSASAWLGPLLRPEQLCEDAAEALPGGLTSMSLLYAGVQMHEAMFRVGLAAQNTSVAPPPPAGPPPPVLGTSLLLRAAASHSAEGAPISALFLPELMPGAAWELEQEKALGPARGSVRSLRSTPSMRLAHLPTASASSMSAEGPGPPSHAKLLRMGKLLWQDLTSTVRRLLVSRQRVVGLHDSEGVDPAALVKGAHSRAHAHHVIAASTTGLVEVLESMVGVLASSVPLEEQGQSTAH